MEPNQVLKRVIEHSDSLDLCIRTTDIRGALLSGALLTQAIDKLDGLMRMGSALPDRWARAGSFPRVQKLSVITDSSFQARINRLKAEETELEERIAFLQEKRSLVKASIDRAYDDEARAKSKSPC